MSTYFPSGAGLTQNRKWYVVDAAGKTVGHLASDVAAILTGKRNPQWTPGLIKNVDPRRCAWRGSQLKTLRLPSAREACRACFEHLRKERPVAMPLGRGRTTINPKRRSKVLYEHRRAHRQDLRDIVRYAIRTVSRSVWNALCRLRRSVAATCCLRRSRWCWQPAPRSAWWLGRRQAVWPIASTLPKQSSAFARLPRH